MLGYTVDDTISPNSQLEAGSNCSSSSDEALSEEARKRKRGSYRCSRCGLPKKGHSCKEVTEPVHVQFSHYDAEQKNFVPQEELIQRLQEENRQLRMANAAILKENQELQEKLKQVGWRLPKSFDTNSKEFAEYPAPAKRQKAFEVDEVPADRFQAPPPYEYMPPPYYNSMSMSYHHRPAVGISVNIQSPPWDMAVQHQSGEVRHAARSPAPPHFERRADVTLPPR